MVVGLLAACGPAEPVVDEPTYTYKDGVFEGISDSSRGYAAVRLFIVRDNIIHVDIVEYDNMGLAKDPDIYGGDRYTLLVESHEALAGQIIAANSADIEGFTGATSTANKVKEAAARALDKALVDRPAGGKYFDGTFFGMSDRTARGWGTAEVTIENDQIVDIKLAGTTTRRDEDGNLMLDVKNQGLWIFKDETYAWEPYHEAKEAIAAALTESQGAEVDIYTGATGSSRQWMQAVQKALEAAIR